jgi:hypothetical protein
VRDRQSLFSFIGAVYAVAVAGGLIVAKGAWGPAVALLCGAAFLVWFGFQQRR